MLLNCSFGAIFTDFCEIAMIISEPNIGKRIRRGLSHTFNHYFRLIFTIFLQTAIQLLERDLNICRAFFDGAVRHDSKCYYTTESVYVH